MGTDEFPESEIAALKRDALRYVIPHFAHNPIDPKIFVRGEDVYFTIRDLDKPAKMSRVVD